MNRKLLGALTATALLAVPASAGAHGSVYQSLAKTGAGLADEVRYVVTNHGFTYVLIESNGLTDTRGMVGYNLIPTAWRTGKSFTDVMAAGGTGAQPHATCIDLPALESEAAIKSWQDADAFYNYVPFQTTSAGLEDTPARWLPTLTGAGVDLAALAADPAAECVRIGGSYRAADKIATQAAALAAGHTEPLEEKIKTLETQSATLGTQVTGLTGELTTAKGQIAALTLVATPVKLTLASAKGKTLARSGAKVAVTGQPLKPVTVALSISSAQAKKLKLASTALGRKTVTTDAAGKAAVTVKLSKAAAKALKGIKKTVTITATATSGDRFATTNGKATR